MTATQTASTESKPAEARATAAQVESEVALHPLHAAMGTGYAGGFGASGIGDAPAGRPHPLASFHRSMGNQAILRSLSQARRRIQTKLTVNQPGDQYEREADHVAEHVMRMPEASAVPSGTLQRKCACGGNCAECRSSSSSDTELKLQTKNIAPDTSIFETEADRIASAVVSRREPLDVTRIQRASRFSTHENTEVAESEFLQIQRKKPEVAGERPDHPSPHDHVQDRILARQGFGSPLPQRSRQFMENRFHRDFGQVRIHTDTESDCLNDQLHAYAFTSGRDIFFANGQYRPGTEAGDLLLAHELTHVVQQGAAWALAYPTWIQRFGKWAHNKIEQQLIEVNSGLLAEVAIPGGTSGGSKLTAAGQGVGFSEGKFNVRGWADLYRAPNNIAPGVKAQNTDKTDPEALGDHPPLKYLNIEAPGRTLGAPYFAPRFNHKTRTWSDTPGFPENFEIGEIKALFPMGYGADFDFADLAPAKLQMDSYIRGLEDFVPRVWHDSNGQTRDSTSGRILPTRENGIVIPPEIDYGRFDSQPASPNRERIILKGRVPGERETDRRMRLWVYSIEPGVLHYFFLPHPFGNPKVRSETERIDGELYKLFQEIHTAPKGIPAKKARPGTPGPNTIVQRQAVPAANVEEPDIPAPPGAERLAAQTKWSDWEQRRKQWAGDRKTPGGARYYLTHTAADVVDKLHVDGSLHIPSAESATLGDPAKVRQIKHWAGPLGKFIGLMRFAFGGLIDKLHDLFTRVKARFDAFREGAHADEESAGGGWKRAAMRVIGGIVVIFLKEIAGAVYSIAALCVNGTIEAVLEKFKAQVLDVLQPVIGPIFEAVQAVHDTISDTFGPLIDEVETVLSVLGTFQKWMDIATDVEWTLRLLIEVLSCEVPPALGCIAGVLAQAGFNIAAARAIATNLFSRRIARPVAHTLVDSIAGSKIRGFISDIMSKAGLGDVVRDVADCKPLRPLPGKRFDRDITFDPNDPEVAASRFDLTNEYGEEFIRELENAFGSAGEPASREQVEDLVSRIQSSGLSIEEFARKLRKEKGKYNLQQALAVASHKGAGASEGKPGEHDVQEVDFSTLPKASGNPYQDSPDYGVVAVGDDSHHKGMRVSISVSVVDKKGPVAVLNNVNVLVTDRETESDGTVYIVYSVREKRSFQLRGAKMLLPDTVIAKIEPGKSGD